MMRSFVKHSLSSSFTLTRTAVLAAALAASNAAWAIPSITFVATDLHVAVSGHEMWRYDYAISGPINGFQDINLLFAFGSYSTLKVLTSYDATLLSPLVTQPDPSPQIQGDGQVTLTALRAMTPTTSTPLSVTFAWLGNGSPAAQSFELLDNFSVIATGMTIAAVVPEPSSAWLALLGMSLLAPALRSARSTRSTDAKRLQATEPAHR